jgi:RsiW-degrading membrane proteinase PrsW (M82 family)
MNSWHKSWMVYSVGLFIAWAIVLILTWWLKGGTHLETAALVCAGFFLGWLSATIKMYLLKSEAGTPATR